MLRCDEEKRCDQDLHNNCVCQLHYAVSRYVDLRALYTVSIIKVESLQVTCSAFHQLL